MFTQKFIKIFHSVQEIWLFSLFQNLNLGNSTANPKWHLTISWATSCQYQCVCKILSKYSKRFKLSTFFTNRPGTKSSQTGRGQNLHKLSGDKIKCLIIGHSMKFNFQLTFLGSYNLIFSSPEPKAHWWAYRIGRPPPSVCRPHSLNIFSSETAWPIKVKFHMEPPWDGGRKVCSNGPGHMSKMAAMPIYGKNLKKSSSPEPKGRWPWKKSAQVLPSLFKWWRWVDLDLFYGNVKFGPLRFCMGKR